MPWMRSVLSSPGAVALLSFLCACAPAQAHRGSSFTPADHRTKHSVFARSTSSAWSGTSTYEQIGTSGVAAMQMSVVDDQYVIIIDKAEHNPLTTSDGNNAWAALLDTHAHTVRPLLLVTNSFCAGELLAICDDHASLILQRWWMVE